MKKHIAIGAFIFGSMSLSAQEYSTNQEGSAYKFEQIAHLDATPVLSQGSTGTCWSFSSHSFFESELVRLGKEGHNLSEMYGVYHAYLGKADKYIRTDGNINFSQGGEFHDTPWVIERYGVVPAEVFDGLQNGSKRHSHSELVKILKGAMSGALSASNGTISNNWKKAIRGILDAYLGEIPENLEDFKFTVDGKEYNPFTYRDELGLKMDEYVSLTSFSNHKFYSECQLAISDNWGWNASHNIPLEDLWSAAVYALETGYTFGWSADVSEDYFDFRSGLAIVPKDKSTIIVNGEDNDNFSDSGAEKEANCFMDPVNEEFITQESRQIGYDNKETKDDHAMHAVGLYKDQNGTKYLLIKNSWGTSNDCDGYFYASESYFKNKTIYIYLHQDGVSKELKKKLEL